MIPTPPPHPRAAPQEPHLPKRASFTCCTNCCSKDCQVEHGRSTRSPARIPRSKANTGKHKVPCKSSTFFKANEEVAALKKKLAERARTGAVVVDHEKTLHTVSNGTSVST